MKFWELISVCREEPELIRRLGDRSEWTMYLDWTLDFDGLVRRQDRVKLDAELPDAACAHVLSAYPAKFFQSEDHVRTWRISPEDRTLTAVDVLNLYGGSFLEDIVKAGTARI